MRLAAHVEIATDLDVIGVQAERVRARRTCPEVGPPGREVRTGILGLTVIGHFDVDLGRAQVEVGENGEATASGAALFATEPGSPCRRKL